MVAVLGAVLGDGLAVGVFCALSWHKGGALDPRCVMHWRGFVEVHELIQTNERVTCEYRPEIDGRTI